MGTRMGAVALAGAAVMAMGPGGLSSAAATATTWTVHPGGAITAAAGKTVVTDTATNVTLKCVSSGMSGTLKPGSGLPGAGIGSVTAAVYNCSMPVGELRLMPRGLPWHLDLVSYDAGTGVSRGTISHLKLALAGPACNAVINGTSNSGADGMVAVTYSDQAGTLKIHPAGDYLHWYHVHGCAGLVNNSDAATVSAAYALSPPQLITSP